ncbi:hypothetical protein BLNAU_10297 [Blattamonas nauphoetae]|uniref:Uncharacterized protein n=1 Tax=Blattamonas nauphoetae TaxID=2049346 RepID=A0ABQ9XTL0_9EUKA|nr:hypothetical protein BLNAU_10297 [Blattamonas nauphoetae]
MTGAASVLEETMMQTGTFSMGHHFNLNNIINMITLFLTVAASALTIGNYTFEVEKLIKEDSDYSVELRDETLIFNILSPVLSAEGCEVEDEEAELVAYSLAEDEDEEKCYPIAINGTEKIQLIRRDQRSPPSGVRIGYAPIEGIAGSLVIDITCSRVERIRASSRAGQYRVAFETPYGCARQVKTTRKFTRPY